MRHPFYMDHLAPDDQRTVRRLYVRVVIFYCWLALFALALVALRIVLDPRIDALQHEGTAYIMRVSQFVGASRADAAEPARTNQCALRDLKLVTSIELHGEAQDMPPETLREAFFTMMKARAACAAGHVGEALAIYDSVAIGADHPARN